MQPQRREPNSGESGYPFNRTLCLALLTGGLTAQQRRLPVYNQWLSPLNQMQGATPTR